MYRVPWLRGKGGLPLSPEIPRVQATDVVISVYSCRKEVIVALLSNQDHIQGEQVGPRPLEDRVDLSEGQDLGLDGV